MKKIFHIIGTDTNIGKTYATCSIINLCKKSGIHTNGLKPLATGIISEEKINPDVKEIMSVNSQALDQDIINPISFPEPISPHLAAVNNGVILTTQFLANKINSSLHRIETGYIFIEGVGGIMTPLNNHETYLDLLHIMPYQIILIVGIKLGCLNHAQLTFDKLKKHNLSILGWIANFIDAEMPYQIENVDYLKQKLTTQYLGEITHKGDLTPSKSFMATIISSIKLNSGIDI